MAVTIKDIAELAKVSKGTVSRVLNNAPGVGPETRNRILKLIQELDYQPNASARGLASRRTDNIGVIIPHTGGYSMSSSYWPALLTSITEKAAAKRMNILLSTTRSEDDVDSAYQTILKGNRIDGLIIGADQFGEKQLAELLLKDIPFVMVGKSSYISHFYVDVDNVGGAYRMTRHLLELGHRKIALLAGPRHFPSVQSRVRGFQQAMNEAGLEANRIYYGSYTNEAIEKEIFQKIIKESPPTAIFASAGDLVPCVLKASREIGLNIPRDLALVSFDDHPFYEYFSPTITVVKQPIHELGKAAVDLLFKLLEKEEPAEKRIILPVEIIVRGSCGSKPDNK